MSASVEKQLEKIQERLRACRKCPKVCDLPVHGPAIAAQVMIIGQAPGVHEGRLGRPFAYTAGKTLFKWLEQSTGLDEASIRQKVYFSAVARCFPGKAAGGKGDRPPSLTEIKNCSEHLAAEVQILRPRLILAVGRSAIVEVLRETGFKNSTPLEEVIGRKITTVFHGVETAVVALPHPSGVSRWPQTEPGKSLLKSALKLVSKEFKKLMT